jgi:hypothetical protein
MKKLLLSIGAMFVLLPGAWAVECPSDGTPGSVQACINDIILKCEHYHVTTA